VLGRIEYLVHFEPEEVPEDLAALTIDVPDLLRAAHVQPPTAPARARTTLPRMPDSPERTRTFTWQDPRVSARAMSTMSGLEFLQAMARGDLPLPPIMATLGFDARPPEAERGKVTFFLEPQEYHFNPIGSVHGGVYAAVLDSAVGCAVHTMLPAGVGYTTLELKVNYVRPLKLGAGEVRCEGTVLSLGRQVAVAEGRVVGADGKLYAHATTTCLILGGDKTG